MSSDIFLKHLAQTSPSPLLLPIERAEGLYLYTPDGKKYADLISGIGVSNIGHRHPKVVQAIKDQLDRHMHVMVYGEFIQSSPNRLAARLISLLPPSLNCCYFTNSGTEANEGALKLAKRYTGRTGIVSFKRSYHGSTHGSLSVSGNETKKNAFRPLLPDVSLLDFNDVAGLNRITEHTACVIIETIQGDAGVRIPDKPFMQQLRKKCNDTGALLVLDEIQCGMGRTGTLFAFEQFEIIPDILTVAKAFGGGLPLGAFVASRNLMKCLTHDPMLGHITTFGGNPVSCAAAIATLEVIAQEKVLDQVEPNGRLFDQYLKHPRIRAIRRIGLMMALDFETEDDVHRIVNNALDEGIICFWFLSNPNSLRLAPPLTITAKEIRECCEKVVIAIEKSW